MIKQFKFKDANTENQYIIDYINENIHVYIYVNILAILLFSFFGILDIWTAPTTKYIIWIIRILTILFYLIIVIRSLDSKTNKNKLENLSTLVGTFSGLGIVLMIVLSNPSDLSYRYYFMGLFLTIFGVYTCFRIRFLYSSISCWFVTIVYFFVLYLKNILIESNEILFYNHVIFFVSMNILGMFAAKILDTSNRKNYILLASINKKNAELSNNIQFIKNTQTKLIESERLTTIGVLAGGISHNLKNQIMSVSGQLLMMEDLIDEYSISIDNPQVKKEDHLSISKDMKETLIEVKRYISFIDEAINSLKNHIVDPPNHIKSKFLVSEVVKEIVFLTAYELKKTNCELIVKEESDKKFNIIGNPNTFIQIINNLIINSIQSFPKNNYSINDSEFFRKIYFTSKQVDDFILFSVKDNGMGIPKDLQSNLFKKMITTKGKDGTGIGLYTSYSKIKGLFNGDMWFESKEGFGTTFFIKIPLEKN